MSVQAETFESPDPETLTTDAYDSETCSVPSLLYSSNSVAECKVVERQRGRSSHLERHWMIDETRLAEHELGAFVGELEKHVNLVAEVPEEVITRLPANYEKAENEL